MRKVPEHLPQFTLINMNGRMYDPLVGRMLSPDNFVQNTGNTQNFNRYSYVLNNPLKYTDPSGNFTIADSWLTGFVHGFFSKGSNRFSNAWNEANKRAGNDAKILGGLFISDPNKSFGGRVLEVVSRFTWQAPQTIGGFLTAQSYNTFGLGGGVESVKYKYGATVIKTNGYWGGITQGSYIIGDKTIEVDANNPLFQHEYGHYLQSQSMGWAYYSRVGIPSIMSKGEHDFHPAEQDVNIRALKYFHKNIDGYSGWDQWRNPIKGYNWSKSYDDQSNRDALNNSRLGLSWYDYLMGPLNFTVVGIIVPGLINALILNKNQ